MTEEEILEGNKSIAEFMGRKVIECDRHTTEASDSTNEIRLGSKICYHSSWEWLMPVVEKISKIHCLDNDIEIDSYYFRTFGMVDLKNEFMVRINRFTLHSSPELITAVYYAVVEFVTWYEEELK